MTEENKNIKPIEENSVSKKRKHSTSSVLILIFSFALLGLFYTSNVIKVNELLSEISELNSELRKINDNNVLQKVSIAKLSNFDRISLIATTELGLVNPAEPPQFFKVEN